MYRSGQSGVKFVFSFHKNCTSKNMYRPSFLPLFNNNNNNKTIFNNYIYNLVDIIHNLKMS